MKKKITVKDLKDLKGKKQLTLILVKNKEGSLVHTTRAIRHI